MSNSPRTFDNFDEYVDNYRTIHNENIKVTGADSDYYSEYRIIEIIRKESPEFSSKQIKILDVGCGDGNAIRFFKKHIPLAHCNGIDITQKVVDSAISRNIPDSHFEVYDGENYPFPDETFDIVFLVAILHHVDRKFHLKMMQEAHRVLKKGGRLYNFEHNPWNPITQKIVNECVFDVDAVLLNAHYLKKVIKKSGFENAESNFTLFFPRFKWFKWLIKTEKYLTWLPLGGQYYIKGVKNK